jgi:long-chain fatty acid transport protein
LTNITKRYVGFYGTDIIPSGTYKLTVNPPWGTGTVVDASTESKHYLGGMAAYIHPISQNLVAGIGIYTPSGLGASWDGTKLAFISGSRKDIEWMSKIGIVTIAPTLAFKVNDMLSFGGSLNINYGIFDISMYAGSVLVAPGVTVDLGQYTESETGWGLGATLGFLFKPSDRFSFGATFRTPSTVKFSGEAEIPNLSYLGYSRQSEMEREVTWPMWLAAGLAFKPVEKFTLTADLQWTQWSKIEKIETDYTDTAWALLMAMSEKDKMAMFWDDALQVRFGGEFQVNPSLALRAGFYVDPSPAPDRTMNILLPNYDFSVLTFGLGYAVGALQIDLGVEYLMGKERSIDFLKTYYHPLNPMYSAEWAEAMPGVYGMKILVPNISVSYRFD